MTMQPISGGFRYLTSQSGESVRPLAQTVAPVPQQAVDPLQDPERLKSEVVTLQSVIPNDLVQLFGDPRLSGERKVELAREYVRLNQSGTLSNQDVANASVEIRAGVQHLKEHKDQIAANERDLAGMLFAPVAGAVATFETASLKPGEQNRNTAELDRWQQQREEELRRNRQQQTLGPGFVPSPPQFASVQSTNAALTQEQSLDTQLTYVFEQGPTRGIPNLKGGPSRDAAERLV